MGTPVSDKAFEVLFKTYFRKLVYFSYQIVANKENAEDIVQEVFLRYLNKQKEKEISYDESGVAGYLFMAVRNASLNFVRNRKVEDKFRTKSDVMETDDGNIAISMMEAEIVSELYVAIESLPSGCQEVIRLGFLEERKNQEIADELGIAVTTVKSQKQRALQLLRLRVSPEIYSLLLFTLSN